MKQIIFAIAALAGFATAPQSLAAVELRASAYPVGTSPCGFESVNSGEANASCGSFAAGDGIDARASLGSIGIRSLMESRTTNTNTGIPEDFDRWLGSAVFFDRVYFANDSGTFRLHYDIHAILTEEVTGSFFGCVNCNGGLNIIRFFVGSTTIFQRYHSYTNSVGGAALTVTDDFGSTGLGFLDVPYSGGALDIVMGVSSEARCMGTSFGTGTCVLGVDAYNSMRLIGSSVMDATGAILPNGFVGSDSGFDYPNGLEPHNSVPVSAPISFLIGGIAVLVARRSIQ